MQLQVQSNALTYLHGSTLRLTPAGETKLKRRMRQLCAQGTPGPELRKILNQEFDLSWSFSAYFQRAQGWGFTWTAALRAGIRLTPAEFLSEDQQSACYEDPAYEARGGVADRVICRECFSVLRDGAMDGKRGHLRTMHSMTREKYRLRNPGAPIFTHQRIADQSGVDVREHMAVVADRYVTPAELADACADPEYEAHKNVATYVICRVARCGFKAASGLTKHLRNVHQMSVRVYRRQPAITPRELLKQMSAKASQRLAKLKAEAQPKVVAPQSIRRTIGRKTEPIENRQFFKIGQLVEQKLKLGKELTAARASVSIAKGLSYSTVARHHKQFRAQATRDRKATVISITG